MDHTCAIFLKSPGYQYIKDGDPGCQLDMSNTKMFKILKVSHLSNSGVGEDDKDNPKDLCLLRH